MDDNQNSVTAGEAGPIVISDFHLIDKLAHFDRERIPERVVHAKGSGAHGYFIVTHDVTKFTKAKCFEKIDQKTPVFARFSTVGGEKGSADTARDPRGFAVKFYTEEGNWDMTGNNTPVFFIRDPIKFPDFIHTQKRNPETNLPDPNMAFDFISLVTESVHQVTVLYSDRGTPDGYRHMNGYGSHTFRWVNKKEEGFWVKFHFKTVSGVKNLEADKAAELRGSDADYAQRDLFFHIKSGKTAEWNLFVQVMPEAEGLKYKWNIFDVTKVWPHSDYPLMPVGRLVLDKNPANYFQDVEQSAFSPGHLVPGIEASFDKMLQGRLFSYPDTHRHRLGANYDQIPINCPYKTRIHNCMRDGPMCVDGNKGSRPNYEPNSFHIYDFKTEARYAPYRITGVIGRFKPAHPNDDFAQAGELYRKVFTDKQKNNIVNNLARDLAGANKEIQERSIKMFQKADAGYGDSLADKLGFPGLKSRL